MLTIVSHFDHIVTQTTVDILRSHTTTCSENNEGLVLVLKLDLGLKVDQNSIQLLLERLVACFTH
jgi:hypothetical protein